MLMTIHAVIFQIITKMKKGTVLLTEKKIKSPIKP